MRGDIEFLDAAAGAAPTSTRARARRSASLERARHRRRRRCSSWSSATSSSTPRRCARRWRSAAAARRAAEAARAHRRRRRRGLDRRPGRPVRDGRRAPTGFAYDNERPRHAVDVPAFRDRPPPGDQRDLAALRRGRRLRAPRVVVGRGLGVEGGVRHHAPRGWPATGGGDRRARPSATSPGSRPTPSPARAEPGSPPRPSGRGRRPGTRTPLDGVGRVWEWTASQFAATPASRAHPYREYSEVFFGDGYRVLRGGSWATHPRVRDAHVPQLGPPPAPADLRRRAAREGRD